MKLKLLFTFLLAAVMQWGVAWAQDGPEMNQVYLVPMNISSNNSYQIPASAFLADAISADVIVENSGWVTLTNGYYGSTKLYIAPYGTTKAVYTLKDEELTIAKNGNLYASLEGNTNVTVKVLNKDANYVTPTPGGGSGSGNGGNDDPNYEPDYTNQQDTDGDGKLDPCEEFPAFGAKVDYKAFPQLTDVPSVYITVYKTTATPDGEGGYTYTYDENQTEDISTTKNDWYYQCRIVIADKYGNMKQRDEMVGLRGRGNSTWTWVQSGKRAFRLKFPSKTKLLAEQDKTQAGSYTEINNFADAKSWTLMANAFDKTLIHNAFTYELGKGKLTNLPFCPAYRFVDLFVNGTYYGTYQVSDQVQVDKNRVNVNSKTGWFLELTASKGGAFLEDPYISVNNGQLYANVKNPENATEGTDTYNAMKDYLTSLYGKLSSTYDYGHDFSFKTGYRTLVDMPSLIDWFIGEEIAANYDGTFGNIYTYREAENDKLHFGPMWDLDIAYGGHEGATMSNIHIWDNSAHAYEGVSNMLRTLYSDKYFVRDLYERWQTIYNNGELKTFCDQKISMLAELVSQTQAKNFTEARPFNAHSTLGIDQADNMGGSFASYDAAIAYFKKYVSDRIDWLNTEYSTKYSTMGCSGLDPCADFGHNDGYVLQSDGSYLKGCDVCGHPDETDTQTYYQFTVYPESKNAELVMATSWEPSAEKPNSIAVVEAKQNVVEMIEGYNIVAGKKNVDGDLTCKDFRLTDGHPYYSDNKFVATTATYSRNITSNIGTICLPFKQQNAVIYNGTEKAITFYHLKSVDAEEMVLTQIEPEIDGNASAYVPVIFVAEEGVTSFTVTGENITVKKSSADKTNSTVDGWKLVGTMEKEVIEDATTLKDEFENSQSLYYFSGGKFYRATGKYTNNPFRAYFLSNENIFTMGASYAPIRIIAGTEPGTTGIERIISEPTSNASNGTVEVSRLLLPLPEGHYNIHGKEIIVK